MTARERTPGLTPGPCDPGSLPPGADATLTEWRAPAWATSSTVQETDVVHTRRTEPVPTVASTTAVAVAEVIQHDELQIVPGTTTLQEAGEPAQVRVVRGEPFVVIEGLWLTLAAAHNLGERLCQLVEDVEAMTGADR